jgi:hypothetical protein
MDLFDPVEAPCCRLGFVILSNRIDQALNTTIRGVPAVQALSSIRLSISL